MESLIIECSLNEQVTREANPHVPLSPDELVADAVAAAQAGAAIIHFHARDGVTGDLLHPGTEFYREVMHGIRSQVPDLLIYPTYGMSPTPEERFAHLVELAEDPVARLDFATIDPGAVNYADYGSKPGELGWDFVLSVSHAECRYFFEIAQRLGIQYSYTVREPGHVRHVLAYRDKGWIEGPILFKITMSENHAWGIEPGREGLRFLTEGIIPDGVPYRWMTYIEGDCHADLSRYAVEAGGHVRTGVGDNPLFDGDLLTNAQQVERVVEMARKVGREIATPAETRLLLGRSPG